LLPVARKSPIRWSQTLGHMRPPNYLFLFRSLPPMSGTYTSSLVPFFTIFLLPLEGWGNLTRDRSGFALLPSPDSFPPLGLFSATYGVLCGWTPQNGSICLRLPWACPGVARTNGPPSLLLLYSVQWSDQGPLSVHVRSPPLNRTLPARPSRASSSSASRPAYIGRFKLYPEIYGLWDMCASLSPSSHRSSSF